MTESINILVNDYLVICKDINIKDDVNKAYDIAEDLAYILQNCSQEEINLLKSKVEKKLNYGKPFD